MNKAMAQEQEQSAPWKSHPAKKLLQKALKDGEVPVDGKAMGPRAVYDKYKDDAAFAGVVYDANFTRRLRDLRKKVNDNDEDEKIDWAKHPAKAFLVEAFKSGTIPLQYDPALVWENHCKDNNCFKEMKFDDAFKRRLKSVAKNYEAKVERCKADRKAFENFRAKHPVKTHNHRGEPRWEGSVAQGLLKQDIQDGKYEQYKGDMGEFWTTRQEYLDAFSELKYFRYHVHQELRLRKFQNYLESK